MIRPLRRSFQGTIQCSGSTSANASDASGFRSTNTLRDRSLSWHRNQGVMIASSTRRWCEPSAITPLPPPNYLFVRVINWVFGTQLLLSFESQGSALTAILLFFWFLIAERIGAYVERPFDQDGSSFSMPLNTICVGISEDLMPRQLDYGRYRPSRNPVFSN